jgi:hypothetical protein
MTAIETLSPGVFAGSFAPQSVTGTRQEIRADRSVGARVGEESGTALPVEGRTENRNPTTVRLLNRPSILAIAIAQFLQTLRKTYWLSPLRLR